LSPADLAAALDRWLANARERDFDVILAGKVFGGRPGEAPQRPEAFTLTDEGFVLRFGGAYMTTLTEQDGSRRTYPQRGTETLTVLHPTAVQITPAGELIVPRAAEARFGWHYYGRPQIPENWCEVTYRLSGEAVEVTRAGPSAAASLSFPLAGTAFVRLARGE
jgi:hypothetical protein